MAITFSIVAIIAIVFILLYMKENEKCEELKSDNGNLGKGAAQVGVANAVSACEYDSRRLDNDLIMEAIRFNGFVPEAEDNWIARLFDICYELEKRLHILTAGYR